MPDRAQDAVCDEVGKDDANDRINGAGLRKAVEQAFQKEPSHAQEHDSVQPEKTKRDAAVKGINRLQCSTFFSSES